MFSKIVLALALMVSGATAFGPARTLRTAGVRRGRAATRMELIEPSKVRC